MTFDVMVIGSKPNSVLPNFFISKIYTANGAAERGHIYKKKFNNTKLNCLVGDLEFEKNINVKKRILNSSPQRIIVRGGKINLPNDLKQNCKLEYLNYYDQLKFQSSFFKGGIMTVIFSELSKEIKLFDKIKYFLQKLKRFKFLGASTGFLSILKAIDENPNSKILITGIGMAGGKQYYQNINFERTDYQGRARVDRFLIKRLKKKFLQNIYTTDVELFKNGNIKLWKL
jgi:hypothetical protein